MAQICLKLLLFLLFPCICLSETFNIAIVVDEFSENNIAGIIYNDLQKEIEGVFEGSNSQMNFSIFDGNNNKTTIKDNLNFIYESNEFHLVIGLGFSTARIIANSDRDIGTPTILAGVDKLFIEQNRIKSQNVSLVNLDYNIEEYLKNFILFTKANKVEIVVDEDDFLGDFALTNIVDICSKTDSICNVVKSRDLIEAFDVQNTEFVFILPSWNHGTTTTIIKSLADKEIPTFMSYIDESEIFFMGSPLFKGSKKAFLRRVALNAYDVLEEKKSLQYLKNDFYGQYIVKVNPQMLKKMNYDISNAMGMGLDILTGAGGDNSSHYDMDLRSIFELALQNNIEIQREDNIVGMSVSQSKIYRSELLPHLNIGGEGKKFSIDGIDNNSLVLSNQNGSFLKVQARQNIINDISFSKYRSSVFLSKSAKNQKSAMVLDTLRKAFALYVNALKAKTNVRILEESLKFTQSSLNDMKNLVSSGFSRKSDLFRLKSEISNIRADLNSAYNNEKRAIVSLNSLINLPSDSSYVLYDIANNKKIMELHNKIFVGYDSDFESRIKEFIEYCITYSIGNLPDIKSIDNIIVANKLEWTASKREKIIPKVEVVAEFRKKIDSIDSVSNSPSMSSSFAAGIDLTLPIIAGGRINSEESNKLDKLIISEKNRQIAIRDISEKITKSVRDTKTEYENFKFAELTYQASADNFDIISNSYSRGEISVIDFLDAKNTLIKSNLLVTNKLYDFYSNYNELQRLIGIMDTVELERFLLCFLER